MTLERRDGESPEAFQALCDYANLPPNDRSLAKAAAIRHDNRPALDRGSVESRQRQLERWSSQYSWQARTRQADSEAAAAIRDALVQQQIAMAKTAGQKLLAALELVKAEDIAAHPNAMPRWIESVGSLSRLLGGQPTAISEVRASEEAEEAASAYRNVMQELEARAQRVAIGQASE